MSAHVIDGPAYARDLKDRVAAEIKVLTRNGIQPGLATVLVGDHYPAESYERRVRRLAQDLDCHYRCERLAGDVEEADVVATVGKLDADPRVSGILILRPLPAQVSEVAVYRELDPLKDIGVGPITDIWLLHNTVSAARHTALVRPARRSLDGTDLPAWDPFEAPSR